jgi:hypothetical protein
LAEHSGVFDLVLEKYMGGFVYVMSNPSFPHLVKIGKSERDPSIYRRTELDTTGVPTPFKVEYYAFVEDHDVAERRAHDALSQFRNSSNREFFSCSIPKAIYEIRLISGGELKFEQIYFLSPDELVAHERFERQAAEKARQEEKKREILEKYDREIAPYLNELSKSLKRMHDRSISFVLNRPDDGTFLGFFKEMTEVINIVSQIDQEFGSKKYKNAMVDFPKFDAWSKKSLVEYKLLLTPRNTEHWRSLHDSFVKNKELEIKELCYQIRKVHGIGSKLARLKW